MKHHERSRNHDSETSQTMMNHDKTMTVKHHDTSRTMMTHHDTSQNIKKYYESLQSTINHHNLYKNYCKVSKNIINYVLITIVVKKYEINLSNSRGPQKMI